MMIPRRNNRSAWTSFAVLLAVGAAALLSVAPAFAVSEGVGWEAFAQVYPTNLRPGPSGGGTIQIFVMNTGARRSSGPITVTDTLPEGVTATGAGGMKGNAVATEAEEVKEFGGKRWDCVDTMTEAGIEKVTCTSNPAYLEQLPGGNGQKFNNIERVGLKVQVKEELSGKFVNHVTIVGGGATQETAVSNSLTVSSSEPEYGLSGWDVWFSNADGSVDRQAGSHPYETTFAFGFNEVELPTHEGMAAGGEPRSLNVQLPPGFFGEPNAVPRCSRQQLDRDGCPADAQIGDIATLLALESASGSGPTGAVGEPLYNMVPPPGVVAEFGFSIFGLHVLIDVGVSGYGSYQIEAHSTDIPAGYRAVGAITTFWGVAAEASHDASRRGAGCREGCASVAAARPFFTLPTSCEGPQQFVIDDLGTWTEPEARAQASVTTHNALDEETGFTGCTNLSFNPSLSIVPDTSEADTPVGLGVNVKFPQEALRTPGALVESTVKNTTVTLPEGLVINPGQAAGLAACTEAEAKLHQEGAAKCPLASKIGTVKVKTPLLEGALESELEGDVYVLSQSKGGPGEPPNLQSHPPTLQLLIAFSADGVNIKLPANVQLDEQNGQLTTTLTETPGIPFTSFELKFSGGGQAALATPAQCGTYTTSSDFTPWSTPSGADQFSSSAFQITGGPDGSACSYTPLLFSPELIAGSTTDQAGGFTDFSLLLRRGDGQQRIERLRFKAPEGLSGMLSAVLLCGEPRAREGACSSASQIGHATVASGPGPYPLVIPQPGDPESPIYLTGPYDGAPFGLSIVTHVIAGPFDLGTIVTRAKIEVDPLTAQITITTDPLPQIIDGVPTDLRLIDSVIDRPGFMFNPTSCDPSSFSGTAWGTPPPGGGGGVGSGTSGPGVSAPIASRFQVGSCQSLQFKPSFSVSTSGKTSRQEGASLHVKLSYPSDAVGKDANIAKVKVDLPKQLVSRLSTLQHACVDSVFDANPAACPADSVVGHAKAVTPLLPVPLEGPAYFVSHGGLKFPELIVVLQGYGVTVRLAGETFISEAGITSSTFRTVPDVPVGTFELTLPEGPDSALAANGNLCSLTRTALVKKRVQVKSGGRTRTVTRKARKSVAATLQMPTSFTAQNGAEIHTNTPIGVTGCPSKAATVSGRRRNSSHGKPGGRK